ncbi:MAG: lysophospholipid acyltransferase family protein [Verrucomicrobia bacterium]|nr:lysophospholipid acyltransferase family protein [Verrucomicrobiota bacterium]MDA1086675.1 lysophospholipid acyltransferase family protein [Verrucomicrobiota bacterium]
MKKLRHLLEFALAWSGLKLIRVLPDLMITTITVLLADAYYGLARTRRQIAYRNVLESGIADNPAEASRIARHSFRHFGLVVIESLTSSRYLTEETWQDHVHLDLDAESERWIREDGRGVILASGHLGNWEIAAQVVSYLKPVSGITRVMNNPYVEQLVQRHKPRNRFTLTPKRDANSARFLEAIRDGKILAFMIDQFAHDRGMMIDFFGRPASTHTAIALLHLVSGTPLIFGYSRRIAPRQFEFKAFPPIRIERSGDKQRDLRSILDALTRYLEEAIRESPEQYLWAHRRWRVPAQSSRH